MELISNITQICTALAAIGSVLTIFLKVLNPLKSIEARIERLETYSQSDYMNTLKLTIMSEEIPLEERLNAGEKYVREGGNGAIKAKYRLLQEEYEKRNGGYQHG